MKRTACVACAVLTIGCFVAVVAEDKIPVPKEYEGIAESTPPKKIDWEKRTEFGSKGNVTVYVDKNGIPTEVYVVGIAPVSTTLVAVEAEEEAREDAEFNAKAAFALWMSERFTVKNVRDKKVLVVRMVKNKVNPSRFQSATPNKWHLPHGEGCRCFGTNAPMDAILQSGVGALPSRSWRKWLRC